MMATSQAAIDFAILFGLAIDGIGAIIVLAPELEFLDVFLSKRARKNANRAVETLKSEREISPDNQYFSFLKRSIQEESNLANYPDDINVNPSRVELVNKGARIHFETGGNIYREVEDIEDWINNLRGEPSRYLRWGSALLFMGFTIQFFAYFMGVGSKISVLSGLVVSLIVFVIIIYSISRYRPGLL